MKIKPYSSTILIVYSFILIGIGFYFIFIRPSFLLEDARFAGASLEEIIAVAPNFAVWINRVFTVLGGYIISTGILNLYLATTSFRRKSPGSVIIITLAGFTSIGLMAAVNLLINSDFKWSLVALAALWVSALFMYGRENKELIIN